MAAPTDGNDRNRKDQPSENHQEEQDPFIRFRRYADEQISSLLQSVMGLPSTFTAPSKNSWMVFEDERRNANQRRQDKSDDDKPERPEGPSRGRNERQPRTWEDERWQDKQGNGRGGDDTTRSRSRHSHDFDRDAYIHDVPLPGQLVTSLWHLDQLPFSHGLFHSHSPLFAPDAAGWPLSYILFSPYSPLHLEHQQRLQSRRDQGVFSSLVSSLNLSHEEVENVETDEPRWRDAFEDLLRLENGKEMLSRSTPASSERLSGNQWLGAMIQRGSLGDGWKFVNGEGNDKHRGQLLNFFYESPRAKSDEENGLTEAEKDKDLAETELDLYDRFLKGIRESSERDESTISPLFRLLLEEQQREREALQEQRRQWQTSGDGENAEDETWLELVSGGNKYLPSSVSRPVVEETEQSTSTAATQTDSSSSSPSIVSTITTTDRRTLGDGSVQTKIVLKKKFSDGTEESNETVHITNPSQQPNGGTISEKSETNKSDNDRESKGGWFWK